MMMTMMTLKSTLSFLLALSSLAQVRAEGFTYPTDTQNAFIEGDLVNVTWDVVAPRISLYEVCVDAIPLERELLPYKTNKYHSHEFIHLYMFYIANTTIKKKNRKHLKPPQLHLERHPRSLPRIRLRL